MQPRKAAAGGLVSKMKLKTIKKRIVIYLVNHVLAGTRFFLAKSNLLRSIGYELDWMQSHCPWKWDSDDWR